MRVTEIIRDAGLMSTLHFTEWARDRGTAVHLACQYYDEGRLDISSVDDSVMPYFEQYQAFQRIMQPRVLQIEREVVHDLFGYVGHLDRIMEINKEEVIVDIKTGAPCKWHGVQLAGYALCTGLGYPRRGLYLSPTAWKLERYDDRRDFTRFHAALTIAQTRAEWNLL